MTTLNSLDLRVLETELARMGQQEWRFIAGFLQEGRVSSTALAAACWQSPWTGGLVRCGVAPAGQVPKERGMQGSVLLDKKFPTSQLSLGS